MQLTCSYYSDFDSLPPGYASLFGERSDLRFDQSLPWVRRLADLLASQGGKLTIVGLETNGAAVAALPLVKLPSRPFGLSADLQAAANFYTAYFGPIADSTVSATEVADALADAIMKIPGGWQVLDLNPLDPKGEFFAGLAKGLKQRGAAIEPYFRFGNWYEEIAGRTYDEYHGGRPKQVRETVRRKRKKLEKETACEFSIITAANDVDAAMDAYESIYTKSWKQAEPHLDFLRRVVKDFAEAGWLRLGLLRVNGQPAAAQMWFVFGGTASIFKLAYDPDFTNYSVGSLLTSHLMNHAITTDRVQVVDYLCGDDPYKKDWMSHRRERWGIRAYKLKSLKGMTGAVYSMAGRFARQLRPKPSPDNSPAAPDTE